MQAEERLFSEALDNSKELQAIRGDVGQVGEGVLEAVQSLSNTQQELHKVGDKVEEVRGDLTGAVGALSGQLERHTQSLEVRHQEYKEA